MSWLIFEACQNRDIQEPLQREGIALALIKVANRKRTLEPAYMTR